MTMFPFAGAYGPFSAPAVPTDAQYLESPAVVFYVNWDVDADDVGSPWPEVDEKTCFSTLQAAIDACVADRGDVIWIKAGNSSYTPAATINFNKSGIRVFGQNFGASVGRTRTVIDGQATTGPAATITKRCHIRDIQFSSLNTTEVWGGNGVPVVLLDGVDSSTDGQGTIFERCQFRNAARTAITDLLINKGVADVEVAYCRFEGHVAGTCTGIKIGRSADSGPGGGRGGHINVHHCFFQDLEYAFDMIGGCTNSFFMHNATSYSRVQAQWTKGIKYPAGGASTFASHLMVGGNYFGLAHGSAHSHSIANLETRGVMMCGNFHAAEYGGT